MRKRAGAVAFFIVILVVMIPSFPVPAGSSEPPSPDAVSQARADHQEALNRIRAGKNDEALPLLERALKAAPDDRNLLADYILCLTWTGQGRKAVGLYELHEQDLRELRYVPRHVARAYYDLWNYPKALELYRLAWSYDPRDEEAFKGVVYSCLRLGDAAGANDVIEKAEQDKTVSTAAIASMRKLSYDLYGIRHHEDTTGVQEDGRKDPEAQRIESSFRKVRWEEYTAAIEELESILAKDPGNAKARAEYIVALSRADRMTDARAQFESFRQAGTSIPWWVHEAIGDTYRYLQQPEEAEIQYRMALEGNPEDPFRALTGLVYVYTDLRRWDKGQETLRRIDGLLEERRRELNDGSPINIQKQYVADRNNAIVVKGWYLISQDRLQEAEAYFDYYLGEAASSTSLRGGLAQAILWQGRPREAREQFEIIRELNPQDRKGLTGLAWTLDELNYKREARALADDLHRRYPRDLNVGDLWETLRVQDMWHLKPEFSFTREFSGATEYTVSLLLEKPLTPLFSLNAAIVRQEAWDSSQGQDVRADWNRAGLGFRWILMPELIWWQSLSVDYVKGSEFGSDTRLMWWPTDPLRITADYNSFSMDVPVRPRARGISASSASADVFYRESDLRDYGAFATNQWFSDGNNHTYGGLHYSQNVYLTPDVKVRAGIEAALGSYTKQNVDYYSPQYDWSVLLTSAVQWVNSVRYEKKWLSAVYLRAGLSGEYGYSTYPVGGVTFEQSYIHSKTFNVTGGVSYDLKVYDGVYTNVLGLYLTLNWYF